MEEYVQITKLNDFLFCPKSLYFHEIYGNFNTSVYHEKPQVVGKIIHESIEKNKYSTSKNVLQDIYVYSGRFKLCGKIDVFDIKSGVLTERKFKIKNVYLGLKYQLYAQMFCLQEMGYEVKKLRLYSVKDNKIYNVGLPNEDEKAEFAALVSRLRCFNPLTDHVNPVEQKCQQCIYKSLCH